MRSPREPGHRKHRLLLVEDEQAIRALLASYLGLKGYEIVEAENGRHGLEIFSADPAQFDLIITDRTMPEMEGDALARAAREIRPDIGVILITGLGPEIGTDEEPARNMLLLAKPVGLHDLVRNVQEMLAGVGG